MAHLLQLLLLVCGLTGITAALPSQQSKEREEHYYVRKPPLEAFSDWDTIVSRPLASDVIKFTNGTELQLFPTSEGVHAHVNGTRRKLGDFRQCSPCTCCDRTRRWCLPTVCCYNIRCGLRGLPYGLCSFIPISCTCFGCRD